MANIFDYIDWRGDLDLTQDPFNEVDSLILSTVSYIDFELIETDLKTEKATIREAGEQFNRLHADEKIKAGRLVPDSIFRLLDVLSRTPRFRDMILSDYVNQIDEEEEKQFSAITINLGDGSYYIAYRGTDDTIVGWKEDFNMSFKAPVPSQLQALDYLEMIAKKKRGKFRIGGHSKGGNIAVYAAAFTGSEIQKRIMQVHNFDGPGFTKDIIDQMSQGEISERIRTIVPQSSVIGMLLEHEESYEVVASTQLGIFQHDMFSWQLQRNAFVKVDDISASAYKVDHTLREFILSMNAEEKEEFVESFFCVLTETGAKTLSDLNLKEILAIMKRLNKEEKENKKILTQAFRMLLKIPTKKQL